MTLPASTKNIGDTGHTADHNSIVQDIATRALDSDVVKKTSGTAQTVVRDTDFTGALTHSGVGVVVTSDARLADARSPLAGSVVTASLADGTVTFAKAASGVQTSLNKADASAPLIEAVNVGGNSGSAVTVPDVTADTLHRYTLNAASVAFTFPAAAAGKSFTLVLTQDTTGGRAATWPAGTKWAAGTAPTLSTGPSKEDWLTFTCADGTHFVGFVAALDVR